MPIYLARALVSTGPQVPWHLWLLEAIQEKLEICSQNVLLLASFSELGTCGNEILTRALLLMPFVGKAIGPEKQNFS